VRLIYPFGNFRELSVALFMRRSFQLQYDVNVVNKKIIVLIVIILVAVLLLASTLMFSLRTGRTSGTISLFVDGERMNLDGIAVEFTFTDYRLTEIQQVTMSRRLRNGCFSFNRSEKSNYKINFLLNSSMWSDSTEEIYVEIQYFNKQGRESKDFEIIVSILTGENVIEVVAGGEWASVSSDNMPINSPYTTVSVRIPSR